MVGTPLGVCCWAFVAPFIGLRTSLVFVKSIYYQRLQNFIEIFSSTY